MPGLPEGVFRGGSTSKLRELKLDFDPDDWKDECDCVLNVPDLFLFRPPDEKWLVSSPFITMAML